MTSGIKHRLMLIDDFLQRRSELRRLSKTFSVQRHTVHYHGLPCVRQTVSIPLTVKFPITPRRKVHKVGPARVMQSYRAVLPFSRYDQVHFVGLPVHRPCQLNLLDYKTVTRLDSVHRVRRKRYNLSSDLVCGLFKLRIFNMPATFVHIKLLKSTAKKPGDDLLLREPKRHHIRVYSAFRAGHVIHSLDVVRGPLDRTISIFVCETTKTTEKYVRLVHQ